MKILNYRSVFTSIFALGLSVNANAVKVHINSGNPAYPFPQFLEYACGGNLGTKNAEGVVHAEMEKQIREAYQHHANEFEYSGEELGGYKYIWTPYKSAYDCTEGDGYALLAAAYMGDVVTFNGYWMGTHDKRRNRTKRYLDCSDNAKGYEYGPFALSDYKEGDNTAADGDLDVALALYVAYKQWGEFMKDLDGNILKDACGNPISYKQEMIEVIRGLVAMSTRFADEKGTTIRVNTGMIGLDGYPKGGDSWSEATSWARNNPIVLSDSKKVFSLPGNDEVDLKGKSVIPEFYGGKSQHIDYNAPAYYREFHDLLKELGVSDEWEIEQFRRAEASSDWLIGQLISKNEYSLPTAGWYSVNEDGSETSFESFNAGEDFRTPWRNISNYVWHGNPKYSWNPVSHKVVDEGNTYQFDAAKKLSKYLNDPAHWNEEAGTSCYRYGSVKYDYTGPQLMDWQIDPMTGMSTDKNLFMSNIGWSKAASSFAAIGVQDYKLMAELYKISYLQWDIRKKDEGVLVPNYMHGWFRQLAMMALSGNYAAPSAMNASSNLKIYRSVKDSVSCCRVGDTITYQLSYRNYGSVDATGVVITENVPADFEVVSIYNGGKYDSKTNTIVWSVGKVAGFKSDNTEGAEIDMSAPNLAKTMGVVSYTCKPKEDASGKYSTVAKIECNNGFGSETNEYPNFVTVTMQRNSIDVIPNAYSLNKYANVTDITVGDTITFGIKCLKNDNNAVLTGGRTGVSFTAAQNIDGFRYELLFRMFHNASEPYVNIGNYRICVFLKRPDEADEYTITNEIIEGVGMSIGSSDRVSYDTYNYNDSLDIVTLHFQPTLSMYTSYLSMMPVAQNYEGTTFPLRVNSAIYPSRYSKVDWTKNWTILPTAKQDENYYPITPSFQDPEKIVSIDKIVNNACDISDIVAENILVEEYDGYVWRKVLGNAPAYKGMPEDIMIVDTIPAGFEFIGFDVPDVAEYIPSDDDSCSGIVRYKNANYESGNEVSVSYQCRYVGSDDSTIKTQCSLSSESGYVISNELKLNVSVAQCVEAVSSDGELVDVFNSQGVMLKSQVTEDKALDNLPAGVYVVGGQKKIVAK